MIPQYSKVRIEELPKELKAIEPLLVSLNKFADDLTSILTKGTTFSDNMKAQVFNFSFTFATGTQPTYNMAMSYQNPVGCFLVKSTSEDSSGNLLSVDTAIGLNWQVKSDNTLTISPTINSFTNGRKYNLTGIVIY